MLVEERAKKGHIADVTNSVNAKCIAVSPGSVEITGGFWAQRVTVRTNALLHHQYEQLEKEGMFSRVCEVSLGEGDEVEGFAGEARLYKWLEATACYLQRASDPFLRDIFDSTVKRLVEAQDVDGYLGFTFSKSSEDNRWTRSLNGHELFAAGHLMQAGLASRRALQDDSLYEVAARMADHIVACIEDGTLSGYVDHAGAEMALIEMYRESGDKSYLDAAIYLIDAVDGRNLRVLRGHSVVVTYFACSLVDLWIETGIEEYLDSAKSLWDSVYESNIYVTGAVGGRVWTEAFGRPFELPHEGAYAETCASIGLLMWNWRMLLATGESKYADAIEQGLFNAILAGVSLDGKAYHYDNPQACFSTESTSVWHERHVRLTPGDRVRHPWFFDRVACCPPNVARLFSQISAYFYTIADNGITVQQYGNSCANFVVDGKELQVQQNTEYPWDGKINLTVSVETPNTFQIRLRIPKWAKKTQVFVDGRLLHKHTMEQGYIICDRLWEGETEVVLELEMNPVFIVANPAIAEADGRRSVARGPLVYCFESIDNQGVDLSSVEMMSDRGCIETCEFEVNSLLKGTALSLPGISRQWELNEAYCNEDEVEIKTNEVDLTAIPYFCWGNRGKSQMAIWLSRKLL